MGAELPPRYDKPLMAERTEPERSTLLVERPELGTLIVTGDERMSWLNGVLSCEVSKLKSGAGRWGLLLTKPAKILTDVNVVPAAERVFLSVAAGRAEIARDWLERFLIMEDADLEDRSEAFGWLELHGARAAALARDLAARHGGHAAAIDWTRLGGAALVLPRQAIPGLEAAVDTMPSVRTLRAEQFDAFRVEQFLPIYGVDFDEHRNPHEASLDRRAVSWDKGCYLGQEAVCMLEMRGKVKRRLVLLELDAERVPQRGTRVTDPSGGQTIGEVTSASVGLSSGRPLAIALLQGPLCQSGASVLVDGAGATVVEPPLAT